MAAKAGKIEKQLKAPDQFVSFWSTVGTKAGEHRKEILIGVASLLAIVVIGVAVQAFLSGRAEEASQAFARIHRIASASLVPTAEPGKDAPAPPPASPGAPQFKTDAERTAAALKEVDDFLAKHASSPLRDEALLYKGRLLLATGKGSEALSLYNELVQRIDPALRFLAREGLAYAEESTGQVDKAIATLAKLAEDAKGAGGFFRDRALFNQARLYEGKGAKQDAVKIYKNILSETPTTTLKEEVNNRLAILESKPESK